MLILTISLGGLIYVQYILCSDQLHNHVELLHNPNLKLHIQKCNKNFETMFCFFLYMSFLFQHITQIGIASGSPKCSLYSPGQKWEKKFTI